MNPAPEVEAVSAGRFLELINDLGEMTSVRDALLLEQSLLKTLAPMLGVVDCSMYLTDGDCKPHRQVQWSRGPEEKGSERPLDRIEEIKNPGDVMDPSVQSLLQRVKLLNRANTQKIGDGLRVAYPVRCLKDVSGFLVFERNAPLSPMEDSVVRGVLDVFSNHFDLLDASQRDRLTGLRNRQAMENNFDRLWTALAQSGDAQAPDAERRTGSPQLFCLAIIDVDHFKRINDSFGHVIGDEVLLLVARIMESCMRITDHLFRYGGEEFVAVISASDLDAVRAVLERVRETIDTHTFPQVGHVSVSIGFAQATLQFLPEEILGNADRALYHAKGHGRNRVAEYEELVRVGVFKAIDYGASELF